MTWDKLALFGERGQFVHSCGEDRTSQWWNTAFWPFRFADVVMNITPPVYSIHSEPAN